MLALVLLLAGGVAGWLIAQRPNTQAARALPVLRSRLTLASRYTSTSRVV